MTLNFNWLVLITTSWLTTDRLLPVLRWFLRIPTVDNFHIISAHSRVHAQTQHQEISLKPGLTAKCLSNKHGDILFIQHNLGTTQIILFKLIFFLHKNCSSPDTCSFVFLGWQNKSKLRVHLLQILYIDTKLKLFSGYCCWGWLISREEGTLQSFIGGFMVTWLFTFLFIYIQRYVQKETCLIWIDSKRLES